LKIGGSGLDRRKKIFVVECDYSKAMSGLDRRKKIFVVECDYSKAMQGTFLLF